MKKSYAALFVPPSRNRMKTFLPVLDMENGLLIYQNEHGEYCIFHHGGGLIEILQEPSLHYAQRFAIHLGQLEDFTRPASWIREKRRRIRRYRAAVRLCYTDMTLYAMHRMNKNIDKDMNE